MKPALRRKKYRILGLVVLAGILYLCFQLFSYKILNLTSRKQALLQQASDIPDEVNGNIKYVEIHKVPDIGKGIIDEKFVPIKDTKEMKKEINNKISVKEEESFEKKKDIKLLRGVHESQVHLYQESSDGLFRCIKTKKTIPFSRVNDDYCDCDDFSDEPGTSACPDSRFYCSFQFPDKEPQFTLGSRVNDGICDCCDGSDEWGGVRVYAGIHITDKKIQALHAPCNNTCESIQRDLAVDKKVREIGQRLKANYLKEGRKAINTDLYGPKGVFYQLGLTCFDFDTKEYKYSICPFKSVTQQRFPGQPTNLGKKPVWVTQDHGKYILKMEDGERRICPEGRERSTLITFICGLTDRVLQVTEEEKCLYGVRFSTPAAC